MTRRKPYTKVLKKNQIREAHVKGMGDVVFKGFQCFKCKKDLRDVLDEKERTLDHTLPAFYLWPLNTENATLLCQKHNNEKHGKWPSEYYNDNKLKRLSVITGFPYELLAGEPVFNPEALEKLQEPDTVDSLLVKYGAYMDELIKIRNRILKHTGIDFFKYSNFISEEWIKKADESLG